MNWTLVSYIAKSNFIYESGHADVAVLLPDFAIIW